MTNNNTQASQQVPSDKTVLTPTDALRNLVNAIGGGKKACGHQFDCSCAFNEARAVLAAATPGEEAVRNAALEEAAALCEKLGDEYDEREGRRYPELRTDAVGGCRDCESGIRALKSASVSAVQPVADADAVDAKEILSALACAKKALISAERAIKGREHTGFIYNALAEIESAIAARSTEGAKG